jgi:hypothetical protein
MTPKITAETLRRDAMRRYLDRQRVADEYDAAADALLAADQFKHRGVISHLRAEALTWRTR